MMPPFKDMKARWFWHSRFVNAVVDYNTRFGDYLWRKRYGRSQD